MFSRRQKGDVQSSISRFADLQRDCVSRVKHLKLLLDSLSVQEKRQLLDEYSFEVFHLVDELLLSCDVTSSPQGAIEAESGLWALEQVLCYAPELVGSGWQRHAIESLLKKAIYPHNLLAVRKIAIRLFLIFYQSLGVSGRNTKELDRVFQSLLPHFPLRSGESTEVILQEYCQSAGTAQWANTRPSVHAPPPSTARERAQLLQVYLDKFLEYCSRETTRIEWSDEKKKTECALFVIEKIIKLYIHEIFPDLEANGVDIYGGWMGSEDASDPLDTADPIVISRYWLIRWMNSLAAASDGREGPQPGLVLFHEALFSSHPATNTLLSLLREAMLLPLACSNVQQKVVVLLSSWLLQQQLPPFVRSGEISAESSSLLLIHIMFTFFNSPYLAQPGDRVQSAVSTTFYILNTCRQLVWTSARPLPHSLPVSVWSDLISRLCSATLRVCSASDAYSAETASSFVNTLLTCLVLVRAHRGVEVDDRLWDDVAQVGKYPRCEAEWSRVLAATTRAVVLHLIQRDVLSKEELEKAQAQSQQRRIRALADDEFPAPEETKEEFEPTDHISSAVTTGDGNQTAWLSVWRRVCLLVPPSSPSAASALADTASTLFTVKLHVLGWWVASVLLRGFTPEILPVISRILSLPSSPLLVSHCLFALGKLLPTEDKDVLGVLSRMRPHHLGVLCPSLLSSLPRMGVPGDEVLRLLCVLSRTETMAEAWLIRALSGSDISLRQAVECTNALCLLMLHRAELSLVGRVLSALLSNRLSSRLLPVFAPCLPPLTGLIPAGDVADILLRATHTVKDVRVRTEMQWLLTSLCVTKGVEVGRVARSISDDDHRLLEGILVNFSSQFPLPSFSSAKWNSSDVGPASSLFVSRPSALLSVSRASSVNVVSRTRVGRHSWSFSGVPSESRPFRHVNQWLKKQAGRVRESHSPHILGTISDPLDALPRPPIECSLDSSEMRRVLDNCRVPHVSTRSIHKIQHSPVDVHEWRAMAVTCGFVDDVIETQSTFSRSLKHLDQTNARETHKVAVIFVEDGQEDKHSILSNTVASPSFDRFVGGLGWAVLIGRSHEGYAGGLPSDSAAPYWANADSEVIFHVSTWLSGDVTQKLKHIGNDEVHVVWCDGVSTYRRETIPTQFCDVLLIIESVAPGLLRVLIQTQSQLDFGPLWDGAVIYEDEAPLLVRLTALNASRAYRVARDTARPLRHREKVFEEETTRNTKRVNLGTSIRHLYMPTMAC